MQNLLDKMSSFLTGRAKSESSAMKEDELKLLVASCRSHLLDAIQKGKDGTEIVKRLTELDCPLSDKYAVLQVDELLSCNNESLEGLMSITTALSVIVKYAQHLIKKCDQRREQWRTIHFGNAIVQKKIRPMKGFETVLSQLGYTVTFPKGLSFPSGVEPNEVVIVNLIADMLLFKKEIKEYILGKHLHPHHLQLYLPTVTQQEVQMAQLNGVKCEDDDLSEASSTQVSYQASENQAGGQVVLPSGLHSFPDSSLVPEAQLPNRTKPECNNNSSSNNNSNNNSSSLADADFQSAESDPSRLRDLALSSNVQASRDTVALSAQNVQEETSTNEQTTVEAIQDLVAPTAAVSTTVTPESSGRNSSLRLACNVCGDDATVFCGKCSDKPLCNGCNVNWHKHPQRQGHLQKSISVLALQSPNSNSVHIDGAYGISAQTNENSARMNLQQQTRLVNQMQNKQVAATSQKIYSPEMSKRFQAGDEDPFELHNNMNAMSAEQLQKIHHPSDFQGFQNPNSQHFQQQLSYAHHLPVNEVDIRSFTYPSPNSHRLQYPDPAHGHLHSLMNQGQQLRSDMGTFNHKYPLENAEYLSELRNKQQQTLPYIQQQRNDHYSQSGLLQQQQPSNWYLQSMPSNAHGLCPYSQNLPQRPGDMGPAGFISRDIIAPPMFQQMHPNAGYRFLDSMGPVSSQQTMVPNNGLSTRSSYLAYPEGPLRYGNMDAQMTMQSPLNLSRGYGYPNAGMDVPQGMPGMFVTAGSPTPSYPVSRQSSSSSSSSLNSALSCLQDQLIQVPDIKKRIAKCEDLITEKDQTIQKLEAEINDFLVVDLEAYEKLPFQALNKHKGFVMHEKKYLERYLQHLKNEASLLTINLPGELSQQIHYPPDIDMSLHVTDKLSGVDASPEREPGNAIAFQDGSHHKLAKSNFNNNVLVSSTSAPILKPSLLAVNSDEKPYNKSASTSQLGSSQTFPPAIPQRLPKTKDLLGMTFPPPQSPKVVSLTNTKNWQCQHCTYINKASAHVCAMCDNISESPLLVGTPDDNVPALESSSSSSSRLQDNFLDLLEDIKSEERLNKKEYDKKKYEDMCETGLEENQALGARICGSQEQVMMEKKKAQAEFLQQQQREKQTDNKIKPADVQVKSKRPSPVPSTSPTHDTQRKPKPSSGEEKATAAAPHVKAQPSMVTGHLQNPNIAAIVQDDLKESSIGSHQSSTDSGSLVDALARFSEVSMIDSIQAQGAELTKVIKMADQEGFDVEAVQIAQSFCENQNMGAIEWLKKNWKKNITWIATKATITGNEQQQNSVGELSDQEAESAYVSCYGNMMDAVQLCVNRRTELYEYLNSLGDYPREEILQAMFQCRGKKEDAEKLLIESKLQPFLESIWAEKDINARNRFALDLAGPLPEMCHSFSTSVIFHGDFQKMVMDKNLNKDRRTRMIFIEGKLKSWGRAELVIKILDNDFPDENVSLEDVVEAVRNCQDRNSALAYLQQECALCFSNFPMSKIRSLNFCQCKMCEQCLTKNFEIVMREKHVRHWTCPLCSLPDMNDAEVASDYLHLLILMLQPLIDRDLQNLFETKVRDWHLQKEVSFRWCAHCAEGFLADNQGENLRMACPHCGKKTCYQCKKQWEPQHEGLTCEQFAQWKIENDPTNQSVGLAKHLDENGIDCPMCKMRFALAKGGCMHFKCPQCGHEFCSGCNEPYHQKDVCNKYKSCKRMGLHCHCPRDCFSYLRDYTIQQLQQLLKTHSVPFNINTPEDQPDPHHCPVMEQKEFDLGKKDETCGKETAKGQAGLCEIHYKEYLVCLINRHGLDPVVLMSPNDMTHLLHRYDLHAPKQKPKETPEEFVGHLMQVVKEKLPLRKR